MVENEVLARLPEHLRQYIKPQNFKKLICGENNQLYIKSIKQTKASPHLLH